MTAPKKKSRQLYEAIFQPIGNIIAKTGIPPSWISLSSVIASMLSMSAYALGTNENVRSLAVLGGMGFLILTSLLDMVDGSVARASGKATRFGMVLDHTFDRYAEFFFLLGIMMGNFASPVLVFFCYEGMIMASFIRAKAESSGIVESCSVGIMERKEKITLILIGSFLEFAWIETSWLPFWPWTDFGPIAAAVFIVGLFSNISALQRLEYTRKQANVKKQDDTKE